MVAIGTIMFLALVAAGYSKRFAIGLIATAGTLGPIVPPSIALIIYGSVTGTFRRSGCLQPGLLPAILIASLLIAYCIVYASFKGYERAPFPTLAEIGAAFKQAAWGLGLPFILRVASTAASSRPLSRRPWHASMGFSWGPWSIAPSRYPS